MEKNHRNPHCGLFMSYFLEGHEYVFPDFEVMHLDACLRSTGQLATFTNGCAKKLRLNCHSTFPWRCFEGESVDIKYNGKMGDKSSFIDLSVKTIVEYTQKIHEAEFLPVANLLEAENTRLIKEKIEKMNFICSFDEMSTAFEDRKTADDRSVETPVILFINPVEYDPGRNNGRNFSGIRALTAVKISHRSRY